MRLIKRYSNRKLYDTEACAYISLEDVAEFIRQGEEVQIVDHASGEDLTTLVLLQVILEQERNIGGLLPQVLLTRLIQAGSDRVGGAMVRLRSRLSAALDPQGQVDEEIRRRVDRLVQAGRLSPEEGQRWKTLLHSADQAQETAPAGGTADNQTESVTARDLDALQQQVAALEQQLKDLAS